MKRVKEKKGGEKGRGNGKGEMGKGNGKGERGKRFVVCGVWAMGCEVQISKGKQDG